MSRYDSPLTPGRIAAIKDEDIDFSDIPELDETLLAAGGTLRTRSHRADHHACQTLRVDLLQSRWKGLPDADQSGARKLRAGTAPTLIMRWHQTAYGEWRNAGG